MSVAIAIGFSFIICSSGDFMHGIKLDKFIWLHLIVISWKEQNPSSEFWFPMETRGCVFNCDSEWYSKYCADLLSICIIDSKSSQLNSFWGSSLFRKSCHFQFMPFVFFITKMLQRCECECWLFYYSYCELCQRMFVRFTRVDMICPT